MVPYNFTKGWYMVSPQLNRAVQTQEEILEEGG